MVKHSKKLSKATKPKTRTDLVVKTPQNTHLFRDASSLKHFISSCKTRDTLAHLFLEDLAHDVYSQLLKIQFDVSCVVKINKFRGYRVVFAKYDPLDISGTLASGGRFNIGGAQHTNKLGNIGKMQGGLYFAASAEAALAEAALPPGIDRKVFRIESNTTNIEWTFVDVEKAGKFLDSKLTLTKSASSYLREPAIAAQWGLIKQPTVSQVIGQWLRTRSGSDGLIFESTKNMDSSAYFIFFETTNDAKARLNPILESIPEPSHK